MKATPNTPQVGIGRFEASFESVRQGVLKYIVESKGQMMFILHCDERESTHLGVSIAAGVNKENICGGGFIGLHSKKGINLRGASTTFKQEPDAVRSALEPLVRLRFLEGVKRMDIHIDENGMVKQPVEHP